MRKQLVFGLMLAAIGITAMPLTASAHDGWRSDHDDREEWREHHWRDRDDDGRWDTHWHQTRYIVSEPVYAQGYYYPPEPVYYVPPPPPRVVYYEAQPVFSFFFGR